jgi:glutamine amidotransferase
MSTIAVIDYGGSNLRSVAKAVETAAGAHARVIVTSSPATIGTADRVVFPGQGAIGQCMNQLRSQGLDEAILTALASGRPFLGICLGLQTLLAQSAEDGGTTGLGYVAGTVARFAADLTGPDGARLKIPHMGWNQVWQVRAHPLWTGIADGARFYFVHSYFVLPAEPAVIAARTEYGGPFVSAISRGTAFATQFHPEKSQRTGLQLLTNFVTWDGCAD